MNRDCCRVKRAKIWSPPYFVSSRIKTTFVLYTLCPEFSEGRRELKTTNKMQGLPCLRLGKCPGKYAKPYFWMNFHKLVLWHRQDLKSEISSKFILLPVLWFNGLIFLPDLFLLRLNPSPPTVPKRTKNKSQFFRSIFVGVQI